MTRVLATSIKAARARIYKSVKRAKASGALKKGACEKCSATQNIHGHHDDYSKPLAVRWLCAKCHCTFHAAIRALTRPPKPPKPIRLAQTLPKVSHWQRYLDELMPLVFTEQAAP